MPNIAPYAKSVIAFIVPGVIALVAAVTADSDAGSSITGPEWVGIAAACILTAGGVYLTPNKRKPYPATNAHHKHDTEPLTARAATATPDQGAILSAVTDYANAYSADKVAAQKAADDATLQQVKDADAAKIADLQAQIDALKNPPVEPPVVVPPPVEPPPVVVPPAPASTAVLGASLGQALPSSQPLAAVRYYRAPAWKGSQLEAAYAKGTRVFVLSTKDATPDNMVALLKAAPSDATFFVTTYHEPDDNIKGGTLTVATYAARMNAMGRAVAGLRNVKFGPIHNGSARKSAWVADEAGCDKSLWSYWGADRYSPNYESPATQFAECRDYAKSLGLPLVLGEVGADPADAAKQKQLASQIRAWAQDPANNAAVICWWQQTGYTFASADVQKAFLG